MNISILECAYYFVFQICLCLLQEKDAVYKKYKEAYVELSDTRGRSQLELDSLNEHLKLANAALQEEGRHT